MVKFAFRPSSKAFGETPVMRSIDVTGETVYHTDGSFPSIRFSVGDKPLHESVIAHAAAFGIKQMLANSYASAGTAKNDAGGLLPAAERLNLWQSSFDKVLAKMTDPETRRNWESVFTEGSAREPVDPVEAEIGKIIRTKLVAWAKAKDKKLPKADSDDYKALSAKLMAAQGASIRVTAETIVATRNAAGDDLDLDFDESDPSEE